MEQNLTQKYQTSTEDNQYLTFFLSNEIFAINALLVKEIITYGSITKVPTMNDYVVGVTNVRGNVMPVISMAQIFGINSDLISGKTCIIIVSAQFANSRCNIGIVVDKVDKVYEILPSQLEDAPSFGTIIKREYIEKIGKVDEKFITIVNSEAILDLDMLSQTKSNKTMLG